MFFVMLLPLVCPCLQENMLQDFALYSDCFVRICKALFCNKFGREGSDPMLVTLRSGWSFAVSTIPSKRKRHINY